VELETSGSTAYPAVKAKGDKSMPLKWGVPEGVHSTVPRDPRDTARAGLPEPQFPAMQVRRPPITTPTPRGRRHTTEAVVPSEPSGRRAAGSEPAQGNEPGAYVALERLAPRECGMTYEARALRSRSARSSRGSSAPPGRSGEPAAGRRSTGVMDESGEGSTRDARC
jgi:hypothetical protein